MSLAAEHGHVTRMRVIDDAPHQAGLADAGFPLDHQRRRTPLAELTDYSRRQAEFSLPPRQRQRPAEGRLSQFASHSPRPPPVTGGHADRVCAVRGQCRTLVNAGERWPALLENVLGATPREFESRILRHVDLRRRAWIMFARCATSNARVSFPVSVEPRPYVLFRTDWCGGTLR